MPNSPCSKCGSSQVIPNARVLFHEGRHFDVEVAVEAKPDSWFFKGRRKCPLMARVCAACGFAELYATDPQQLWAAHQDRDSQA
jgi:hypothetical protein